MRGIRGLDTNARFFPLAHMHAPGLADRDMARLSQERAWESSGKPGVSGCKDKGHRFSSGGRALFPQDSHGA